MPRAKIVKFLTGVSQVTCENCRGTINLYHDGFRRERDEKWSEKYFHRPVCPPKEVKLYPRIQSATERSTP